MSEKKTKVSDWMTQKVFTLKEDQTLHIAKEIMDWARIRHIPVVDRQNRLVGIVTHRDLLRASISCLTSSVARMERDQHLWTIPVRKMMAIDLVTLGPEDSVRDAAKIMRSKKIGAIPIVGDDEKLLGILSEADLLRFVETA